VLLRGVVFPFLGPFGVEIIEKLVHGGLLLAARAVVAIRSSFEMGARVCCVVHGLELADRDLCVDGRRRSEHVAKKLLNVADVGTAFEHQRCHRMAQKVAGPVLPETGLLDVAAHHLRQSAAAEGLTSVGEKQRAIIGRYGPPPIS
jgi:hypothetical protein